MRIHGVEVLGSCGAIPALTAEYDVDMVVVAVEDLSHQEYQAILEICHRASAQVKVIPDVLQVLREPNTPSLRTREGVVLGSEPLIEGELASVSATVRGVASDVDAALGDGRGPEA
jgi:FlaA1/EpsC-like NDP-sugar epimerase